MFWGERAEERARNSLSDALSHLRRVLGRAALPAYHDDVALTRDTPLTVDVVELHAAARAGDHVRVVELYTGPFLDGVHVDDAPEFEHWRDAVQAKTGTLVARACSAVCAQLASSRDWGACEAIARRWLGVDLSSGQAAFHLLDAVAAPDTYSARVAAVREYRALAERLRDDVGVAPDPAVSDRARSLIQQLEQERPVDGDMLEAAVDRIASRPPRSDDSPAPTSAAGLAAAGAPAAALSAAAAAATGPSTAAAPVTHSPALQLRRHGALAAALSAFLLLAAAMTAGNLSERSAARDSATSGASAAVSAPYPRSVAVLRFRNIGGDSDNEYFSDGMAEEIMHALARIEGVQVAARGASFPLSADSVDVRDVGRRLNVATVLEGSVRRSGATLRVTVRLVNAGDGYALWHHTYERDVAEAFAVQDEVARAVAAALQVQLERDDGHRRRRAATNFETYDLYLRGRFAWWTADTEEEVRRSISYFRRALARDSSFAPAWVGLADAFLELTGSHDVAPADVVPHARAALTRAQALDPFLADALASLGYLGTFHERRWDEAEAMFRRALTLDARHTNARLWFAWMLSARGRHDEAVQQLRQALSFEPTSPLLSARLATMLYFARDFEGAARQAQATIEADAGYWLPHRQLGEALVQLGRHDEGVAALRQAAAMAPGGETRARHAYGLARAGDTIAARAILQEIIAGYVSPVELARVNLQLGERERALHLLEQAAELGVSAVVLVGVEPAFDPLRGEPRLQQLVRRLGLQ